MTASPRRGGLPVNAQQAAIIDHLLQHPMTVVSAGAGAGKTYTVVAGVLELLERTVASVDELVLITFTNKAADELRERLEEHIAARVAAAATHEERAFWRGQQERLSGAYVGTIHGYCAQLLRTFGYEERVARESGVTFARSLLAESLQDATDQLLRSGDRTLLSDPVTWNEYDLRREARRLLDYMRSHGIGSAEVRARTLDQADDAGKTYRVAMAQFVEDVHARYETRKRERQELDADDLLEHAAQLLQGPAGPAVVQRIAGRRAYLFVDEFQDTDPVQKRIVDALTGYLRGIAVVGDRKQSIYGFRSAAPHLLDEIARENGVRVMPLNVSRRPTQQLLDAQNALFRSIGTRFPELAEPLEPYEGTVQARSPIPPLSFIGAGDWRAQQPRLRAVADLLRRLVGQQIDRADGALDGVEQGDITILVRTNTMLRQYVDGLPPLLVGSGIEVHSDTAGLFYRRSEIVSTYHMLRALLLYPDDMILSTALRTPYLSDVDPAAEEQRVLQYRPTEGTPITDWFEAEFPQHAAALDELRRAVRVDTVPQILAALYRAFGITDYYASRGDVQALENLEKLRELARSMFQNEQALTLRQFVWRLQVALLTEEEESEALTVDATETGRPPYVRIMTIHQAKGLEFPIVIVPEIQVPVLRSALAPSFLIADYGLDIQIPSDRIDTRTSGFRAELARLNQDQVDEEFRLFYVAVTRAQNAVFLIGDTRRQLNGPASPYYAWQDEILRARAQLTPLGAQFTP